jgi:hypothetical protein
MRLCLGGAYSTVLPRIQSFREFTSHTHSESYFFSIPALDSLFFGNPFGDGADTGKYERLFSRWG